MSGSVGCFYTAAEREGKSFSSTYIGRSEQVDRQRYKIETLELIDWRREAWKNVTFLSKDCYANAGAVARRRE
jgi:hypothetical protein